MARYLVTMLVGVTVEAPDEQAATNKAILPLRLGLLPNMIGATPTGTRLANEGDTPEGFAERHTAMVRE